MEFLRPKGKGRGISRWQKGFARVRGCFTAELGISRGRGSVFEAARGVFGRDG